MCPSYMSEDDGPPLLPIISSSPSKKAQISRNHVPAPPAPTPSSNRGRSINFPSLSDCGRDTCFDSLLFLRPCSRFVSGRAVGFFCTRCSHNLVTLILSLFSPAGGGMEAQPRSVLPGGLAGHRQHEGRSRRHLHHLTLQQQRGRAAAATTAVLRGQRRLGSAAVIVAVATAAAAAAGILL